MVDGRSLQELALLIQLPDDPSHAVKVSQVIVALPVQQLRCTVLLNLQPFLLQQFLKGVTILRVASPRTVLGKLPLGVEAGN